MNAVAVRSGWIGRVLAYAVSGGVFFGAMCGVALWLVSWSHSDADFGGVGGLMICTAFGAWVGVVYSLALAGVFLVLALLVPRDSPTFSTTMTIVGAGVGAMALPMGLLLGAGFGVVVSVVGAAYGAFVGRRVADLRRS